MLLSAGALVVASLSYEASHSTSQVARDTNRRQQEEQKQQNEQRREAQADQLVLSGNGPLVFRQAIACQRIPDNPDQCPSPPVHFLIQNYNRLPLTDLFLTVFTEISSNIPGHKPYIAMWNDSLPNELPPCSQLDLTALITSYATKLADQLPDEYRADAIGMPQLGLSFKDTAGQTWLRDWRGGPPYTSLSEAPRPSGVSLLNVSVRRLEPGPLLQCHPI